MAGDWLKFEKSTSDKPEVWAMADQLAIDPDAVVGKLLRVWAWFDEQSESGNAPSVSKMLLDRRVGVTGFCDAMVLCGWMEDDGREVTLPNFDRHNGKTAKNRSLTAKRVARHKQKTNDKGNDQVTPEPLPREEKRREENKDKDYVPPRGGTSDYPPEFEQAWKQYPKRSGGNPKKAAYDKWKARIREGIEPAVMIAGVERYAKHCKDERKINTPYVMQGSTFFGPSEHFMEEYESQPKSSGRYDPTVDRIPQSQIDELIKNVGVR